jgi:hypothetical protein
MDKSLAKKIALSGKYEDVVEVNDHLYIINKKQRLCVIPYTISQQGLLDLLGVTQSKNTLTDRNDYTLINGYISEDDGTDLVAANRVVYETTGSNVTKADNWMYLGSLYNKMTSDSEVKLYAVNFTDVNVVEDKEVEENKKEKKFKMLESNKVVTTDDSLLLASYLRLLNYFYINSLK